MKEKCKLVIATIYSGSVGYRQGKIERYMKNGRENPYHCGT